MRFANSKPLLTSARLWSARGLPPLWIWRFALTLILGATSAFQAADQPSPHDPAEELASFQIADGFEVNLFASEKDGLIKPIQIRFDARGRLWVIGSAVYPQIG